MNALIVCPECQRQLKVPESAAGKPIRCPACKATIPASQAMATKEAEPTSSEPLDREGVTTTAAPPPLVVPVRQSERDREEFADRQPRGAKKPIRQGAPLGLILGLIGGGVVLVLALGGGLGLVVYFALNKTIPDADWQAFSPPNSGCTILLPGTPSSQPLTINGLTISKYVVERKRENALFAVAYADLGGNRLQPTILDIMMRAERENLMRSQPGSQVNSELPITLGALPGRELQLKPPHRGTLIERIYLAKVGSTHRVYLVIAGGDNIRPNTGDAARFFDSFQVTVPATPPNGGGGPVAQGPQPPIVNPPGGNPPRPKPPVPPGQRAVWNETSGTQSLCLAFSPDSRTLAVGHWDKKLRLWDVAGGKDRQVIGLTGSVFAAAFSGDGKRLACGTDNGDLSEVIVPIWDVSDVNNPKEVRRLHLRHTRDKARAKALRFTPDGKALAVALVPDSHSGSQVLLWDLENNQERAAYRDCKEDVKTLAFTADGAVLILTPSSVRVWDAAANRIRREFKTGNPVEQASTPALSPDGQRVATLSADKKLKLWRLSDGTCRQTWPTNADVISQIYFPLEFSPDGKYLALGARGPNLYLWDARDGKERKVTRIEGSSGFIDVVAFSPDGRLLACHSSNGPRIFEVAALLAGN